jgi:hypothetical protein
MREAKLAFGRHVLVARDPDDDCPELALSIRGQTAGDLSHVKPSVSLSRRRCRLRLPLESVARRQGKSGKDEREDKTA